jgi:hypothetical protein
MHYFRETVESKFDGSVVGIMTKLQAGRYVIRIPTATRHFFSYTKRLEPLWGSSSLLFYGYYG